MASSGMGIAGITHAALLHAGTRTLPLPVAPQTHDAEGTVCGIEGDVLTAALKSESGSRDGVGRWGKKTVHPLSTCV